MPWLPSSSARLLASSSKALSSSKEPWTKRTRWAGRLTRRPSRLVLELLLHRRGELVPGVDELLHALLLQHPEDVVQVDPGLGDGLHNLLRVGVGRLHRGAGLTVVGVGHQRL